MHVNWSFPGPCGPCRHIPFAGEEPAVAYAARPRRHCTKCNCRER